MNDQYANAFAARLFSWQGADGLFMARAEVKDPSYNQVPVVQSQVSSISYAVYDAGGGGALIASGTLTVNSVVFNTLQTGSIWTVDKIGFNFAAPLPAAANFPNGGNTYSVVFNFTLSDGSKFPCVFENVTRSVSVPA